MVPFKNASGYTLLIPSGPSPNFHLFIVLTNPIAFKGFEHVLLVNVSTIHPGIFYDKSCTLHTGDHPFIKPDSYILI